MTKLRAAGTVANEITRIASLIGYDAIAQAVGCSEKHARRWADPNNTSIVNLHQVAQIDQACWEAGHGTPLSDLLQCWMGSMKREHAHQAALVKDLCLEINSDFGKVSASVLAAISENSPGGEAITPSEASLIRKLVGPLRRSLDRLDTTLQKKQRVASSNVFPFEPMSRGLGLGEVKPNGGF